MLFDARSVSFTSSGQSQSRVKKILQDGYDGAALCAPLALRFVAWEPGAHASEKNSIDK
jgi:hypothetical protein